MHHAAPRSEPPHSEHQQVRKEHSVDKRMLQQSLTREGKKYMCNKELKTAKFACRQKLHVDRNHERIAASMP
jgi:hypothetical protein